jgi:hypothetical protein
MDENQTEIVRKGEQARALLVSEAFVTTVADLKSVWLTELLGSPPEGSAKREEMYRLYIAMQAIEGVIGSRVDAMDAVHAMIEAEQKDDEEHA